MNKKLRDMLIQKQRSEITEHFIYAELAEKEKSPKNRKILTKIADEELHHYEKIKEYTKQDVEPHPFKIILFTLIARIFGLTFGLQLMENGEENSQSEYKFIEKQIPTFKNIEKQEKEHEQELLKLIEEEKLEYTGSIVLGLNDALVELTGALAGLTFALQNATLIALTGSITGISAALSMAASEYLSTKDEPAEKHPFKAATYTGIAYIITVVLLILPFLFLSNVFVSLGIAIITAIIIIAAFNYYVSVAKRLDFKRRFFEMAGLSLSVALISFLIGIGIKVFIGVDI